MKKLLLSFVAVSLAGCASFSKRLEVATVAKIRTRESTRKDVENLLGHPKETVTGANGITVARYFFREFRSSEYVSSHERHDHPGDILLRTLTLKYGVSNIVEQKLHDESITAIYRTNAWFFAGSSLTPGVAA